MYDCVLRVSVTLPNVLIAFYVIFSSGGGGGGPTMGGFAGFGHDFHFRDPNEIFR